MLAEAVLEEHLSRTSILRIQSDKLCFDTVEIVHVKSNHFRIGL